MEKVSEPARHSSSCSPLSILKAKRIADGTVISTAGPLDAAALALGYSPCVITALSVFRSTFTKSSPPRPTGLVAGFSGSRSLGLYVIRQIH